MADFQPKADSVFGQVVAPETFWWVTRRGLMQSTRAAVATLKSSWLDGGPVVDACCGLGGDLIAMARRGPVIGIDGDPETAEFAAANLVAAGCIDAAANVRCFDIQTDAMDALLTPETWLHIDPDRRAGGRRHTNADAFSPPWTAVARWLDRVRGGIVKLAPATQLPATQTEAAHQTWVSSGGSVREQTLLTGDVLNQPWPSDHGLRPGGRSAIMLRHDGEVVFAPPRLAESFPRDRQVAAADSVRRWIIDPDAAIRAAGLTLTLAEQFSLRCLGGPAGFLTTDADELPQELRLLAVCGDVTGVLTARPRRWKEYFRDQNAHVDAVKVRGGDYDPPQIIRQLRACGDDPRSMWIVRVGSSVACVVTKSIVR